MPEQARITVDTPGDAVILGLWGEVDVSNIADVAERIKRSIDRSHRLYVVDLSRTGYLDSVGIRFLFALAERLKMHRQQLRIVVPDDSVVRPVLVLADIPRLIPVHRDVSEALAASAGDR